jgi:hypothetical protein
MTTENPEINVFKIVEFGAKVLNSGFLSGSRERAKQEFKKLKQGKLVEVGTVSMGKIIDAPFKLQLDYSEFQGPGFGFDSFSAALTSMLRHTDSAFKAEKDLNVLMNDEQSELVLGALPGIVQHEGQTNVMMMSFSFSQPPDVILKLMFVEPDQFSFVQTDVDKP